MSFYMRKKLLGLTKSLTKAVICLFLFFLGGGEGGGECKVIWRIVHTSEKILATPLTLSLLAHLYNLLCLRHIRRIIRLMMHPPV